MTETRDEQLAREWLLKLADDLAHVEPKDNASRKILLKVQRSLEKPPKERLAALCSAAGE